MTKAVSKPGRIQVLAARLGVEHFDSPGDAFESLQKLDASPYDVVLVDVNLPELSEAEFVDQLNDAGRSLPSNVFLTPHDEPAVEAFEPLAMDYALSEKRIGEARETQRRQGATRLMDALAQLQKLPRPRHSRIAIKANGRILFIDPREVIAVEAEGNYVLLRRSGDSYLLRESISAMAEALRPYGFIRIHRSVLVNASLVEGLKPYPTGEYGLHVKGGREYTVTRTYKKNLKSLAELWIGTETFLSD